MVSLMSLTRVLAISAVCNSFLLVGSCLGCIIIPLRYLGVLKKPEDESPKVKIFVHEPSKDGNGDCGTTPRDTLLLVHGFPDNQELWDKAVKAFTESGYRCLVVALPGSNGETVSKALTFEENAALIKESVEAVTDQAVTVIGHDWGSVYSMTLQKEYPSLCKRMILLDVGGMKFGSDIHWSTWYALFSYQSVFALSYWLGHPFGTWLMKVQSLLLFRMMPKTRRISEMRSDMAYHYAGMLKQMTTQRNLLRAEGSSRPSSVAHLYVYGSKKPFYFHDSDWLNFVRSTPCGKVTPLPCGHWLMVEEPDALHKIVLDWLDHSSGGTSED
eukprot:TRINITY_DN1974_c0_g1_i1.p1 TRINITY_DN1974_c0_g1~~TRINITY_DN1974_c0_g1_i1.p1  ORF type:complete len:328 (+),score=33.48 TRINITY_DN1974_c0_g1_i1:3054-4037(+)